MSEAMSESFEEERMQTVQQTAETDTSTVSDVSGKVRKRMGMRINFSEEKVLGASDALEIIFPNRKTQTAARLFVEWLSRRGGQASKTAVRVFADEMQSGIIDGKGRPFKYSKRNFYMTVLRNLVAMGFIRRNVPVWDERSKTTLYVYMRNIFDIPQKPPSVGFWRLAYYVSKKWNKFFLNNSGISE